MTFILFSTKSIAFYNKLIIYLMKQYRFLKVFYVEVNNYIKIKNQHKIKTKHRMRYEFEKLTARHNY